MAMIATNAPYFGFFARPTRQPITAKSEAPALENVTETKRSELLHRIENGYVAADTGKTVKLPHYMQQQMKIALGV